MSNKKRKVIHVDNLIIHAENVQIKNAKKIKTTGHRRQPHVPRRDPWGFFWGPQNREHEREMESLEMEQGDDFGREH